MFVLAVSVIVLGAGVAFVSKSTEQLPLDTTVKLLSCDPNFYTDKQVRISIDGMMTEKDILMYKTLANQSPIVICRFNQPLPDKLPKYVIGTCIGRKGSAVEVINCTLSDKD